MAFPYIAKKMTYLTTDGRRTREVFHPAIKFPEEHCFCFFPDESTESGLIEYDNPEDALTNAIALYQYYTGS